MSKATTDEWLFDGWRYKALLHPIGNDRGPKVNNNGREGMPSNVGKQQCRRRAACAAGLPVCLFAARSVTARQRIYRVFAACLLLLLVACGNGAASTANVGPTAAASSDASRVTLVLWHAWSPETQPALGALVDRYNQGHPNVRIVLQAMPRASLSDDLRAAVLAGSGPHLVLLPSHGLGTLVDGGVLRNLDDLFSPKEVATLLPVAVDSAEVADTKATSHLYGLPIAFDTPVLYYNKDNVLKPPTDTDQMLSAAHGLTDSSTQPPTWGLAYNLSLDTTIGYMYAFGGRIFDEQGKLVLGQDGRAGAERWLDWLLTLHRDQRLLAVADGIQVDGALKAQQALMTVNWANQYNAYQALWGDQVGVAPLPQLSVTGKAATPYVQSEVLCINARVRSSNEQQAAVDFGRFLLSSDAQGELLAAGRQPTLLDLKLDGDQPKMQAARAFREQATHGLPMPNSRAVSEIVWPAMAQMLRSVLQGQLSPADAVTQTDQRLRTSIP